MAIEPLPEQPLVSIVTPCFNAAKYVSETVRSVLAQDYPRIEYLVMDGGSTDGTLEILKQQLDPAQIRSEPDSGPAEAINRGFRASHGQVFAFLNADDYYLPGAVSAAVRQLQSHADAAVVYGDGIWVDESGQEIAPYPVAEFDADRLARECFICQPSAFLRRDALEAVNLLDDTLKYAFDYDLWIRMARRFPMVRVEERLSASRMHRENISIGSRQAVFEETIRLLLRHYGYAPFEWIHSYCSYRADRRDQFFEPLKPSFTKYLMSLPVGLYFNSRHPWRFFNEWRKVMTPGGLKRRLAATWRGQAP